MYAFTFHRPQTVRQAAGLLTKNPDAKLLAGGQTLLPTMKLRLAGPPQIIDMSLIEGMSGIELSGRSLTIGAIANNHPNTDYPAACHGLCATIITNKRRIKADYFFDGMFSTEPAPTEI